jgi:hypothetical protein
MRIGHCAEYGSSVVRDDTPKRNYLGSRIFLSVPCVCSLDKDAAVRRTSFRQKLSASFRAILAFLTKNITTINHSYEVQISSLSIFASRDVSKSSTAGQLPSVRCFWCSIRENSSLHFITCRRSSTVISADSDGAFVLRLDPS